MGSRRLAPLKLFETLVFRFRGQGALQCDSDERRGTDDWHLAVELYPPHRTRDLLKVRASVETATGLFINDTLPEASARLLAAIPTAPREEHAGFVVERIG